MTVRVTLIAATAALTALAGCATDPYGQPTQMNRAQQGVIAGAAAGALYGAVRDDDKNNRSSDIIKGAIVGGAAGGLVGSALDAQARARFLRRADDQDAAGVGAGLDGAHDGVNEEATDSRARLARDLPGPARGQGLGPRALRSAAAARHKVGPRWCGKRVVCRHGHRLCQARSTPAREPAPN